MNHIGGFFELEPEVAQNSASFHASALALSTGRACLMMMLFELRPTRVFVPHYTCDALLEPLRMQGIEIAFYALNRDLSPKQALRLGSRDFIIYINYFGLCDKQVCELSSIYGRQLLVDDTHAFFHGRRTGHWSFTSARKYFGVPDGAYLFAPLELPTPASQFNGDDLSHLELRSNGLQKEAFAAYQVYEGTLDCSVARMSLFSSERLLRVDYSSVAKQRRRNFDRLHAALGPTNKFVFDYGIAVPFCYPYLCDRTELRFELFAKGIYPPTLWSDVVDRAAPDWEIELSTALLPLPIDHRYGDTAMQQIIDSVMA